MYRFHNNNSLGLFTNDCTIRAISTATNNTWDDTYEHLSNSARIRGKMMDDKSFIIEYLDDRYNRIYDLPLTVGETAGKYADNVLLITMGNHIVCSKFGVVYDSFDCRDRKAEYCWAVK